MIALPLESLNDRKFSFVPLGPCQLREGVILMISQFQMQIFQSKLNWVNSRRLHE